VKQLVYDPIKCGVRLTIACFVSGSGTNYREIVARSANHYYIVFTNRPGCGGVALARSNKHEVVELSHTPYLKDARKRYGSGNVPRNCPERVEYEQALCALIEDRIGGEPDLVCLAGYDQWLSDFIVDKYYPRILNVHPGDTTKGYDGLQSGSVNILQTIDKLASEGRQELLQGLHQITGYVTTRGIENYEDFQRQAGPELLDMMELICKNLQEALKVVGDWKIYPFAVHDLIARGRVQINGSTVYVDDKEMPEYGYRIDEHA
jgi:folate-dependent phosphoribosylglycinamide formyltransferase PurN